MIICYAWRESCAEALVHTSLGARNYALVERIKLEASQQRELGKSMMWMNLSE